MVATADPRRRAEAEAWDEHAAQACADVAAFEATGGGWEETCDQLLDALGPVEGRLVLDCGCGEGLLSRAAAERGGRVVGFDVSFGMLTRARSLTGEQDVSLTHSAFEEIPVPDATFAAATGMFVLHHVDLPAASRELARVLEPGGRASFIETWQRNPLLRLARRLRGHFGIAFWGTDDERPLEPADLDVIRDAGFAVRTSFPTFVFFQLFDNNVLRRRWAPVTRVLTALDRILGRVPLIAPYGYYCVVELERLGPRGLTAPDAA